MEDLAGIDEFAEPTALCSRALNRPEKGKQSRLVDASGILRKSLTQRQMLSFRAGRQFMGIGGEKRERCFFVFAVFCEIEMDTSHQIPNRILSFQEIFNGKV